MSANENYWTRHRVSRRAAIRGTGLGVAGLAGAALIGCGGSDNGQGTPSSSGDSQQAQQVQAQQSATAAAATVEANATAVPKDQVRLTPGFYDSPIPPSPAEANPMVNARYGDQLVGYYLDPPHMDINRTLSCTVYHTMNYTQNKLVRGKTGPLAHPFIVESEPDLADSWEANPDSTEFTFHLRQGIKTHNVDPTFGREFTSEDVRLSVERYSAGGAQKDVFSPVTAIETPDDYTVKFMLDQPLSDFPVNVSSWSYMWVKELIADDTIAERAVGTGPFVQKEWVKKEHSTFVKHAEYFEEGLPFLDEIFVLAYNADLSLRRAAYQTDNIFEWGARDDPDGQAMVEQSSDTVLWKYPVSRGANTNGWHYQMSNPVFQDERVRRAIALAFDKDEFDLAQNSGDNANPEGAYSQAPMPWSLLYDDYPTAKVNGPWYQYDPAQASQLMQAAGFTKDNPLAWEHVGFYDRTRFPEVIMPGINGSLPEVNISFRQVDNPTAVQLLSDRNFEWTADITWGPAGFSMDQWIFPWYHSKGGLNYNNVDDAEMDSLLEAQRRETALEAKKEIWQKVWDRIFDQVWDQFDPVGLSRTAWHSYALNYRPHGLMSGFVCYTSDQARAIWLDEGQKLQHQG